MMQINNLPIAMLLSVLTTLLMLLPRESLVLGQGSSNKYPMPPMNYTTFVGGENSFDINDFIRDDASTQPPPTTRKSKTVSNYYTGRDRGQRDRYGFVRNLMRIRDMFCNVNLAFDNLVKKYLDMRYDTNIDAKSGTQIEKECMYGLQTTVIPCLYYFLYRFLGHI